MPVIFLQDYGKVCSDGDKKIMKEKYISEDLGEVLIRPAVTADRESILAIVKQTGNFSAADITVAEELVDEAVNHPEKGNYRIFCALNEDNRVIGYICYGPIPLTQGCYDLYWIAVDSQYARHGVGLRLLKAVEHKVLRQKGRRIYIDTSSTEAYGPARRFYEQQGFRQVCVLDDFYQIGDHKVLYMKELAVEEEE